MGAWGITAFESDDGLDAVSFIRKNLPKDGTLDLDELIEAMMQTEDYIPDAEEGRSHTGTMALAEIVVKFMEHDSEGLDYDGEWAKNDNKFKSLRSFTVTKNAVQWMRGYLADNLYYARKNAMSDGNANNGWYQERDWIRWQKHTAALVSRLDTLLMLPKEPIELLTPPLPDTVHSFESECMGITQDTFIREMRSQFDCSEKAVLIWIKFTEECVDNSQYVDFRQISDNAVEMNRWMEAVLMGLVQVQNAQGLDAAKKVCDLAAESQCLYPYEMQKAAECLQSGGTREDIIAMIESGDIEQDSGFEMKF